MVNEPSNSNGTKKLGKGVGFQHKRRVTGYLADDVSLMNNAKQAEVAERVKHVSVVQNVQVVQNDI